MLIFFYRYKGRKGGKHCLCRLREKLSLKAVWETKRGFLEGRDRFCVFAATAKRPDSIGKRNAMANNHRFKIMAVCSLSLASRLSQKWAWDFQSAHQLSCNPKLSNHIVGKAQHTLVHYMTHQWQQTHLWTSNYSYSWVTALARHTCSCSPCRQLSWQEEI